MNCKDNYHNVEPNNAKKQKNSSPVVAKFYFS